MPRYFFHLARGSSFVLDEEGDELANDEAAKEHADLVAGEMLEERHKYAWRVDRSVLLVTDDAGRHVATVAFSPGSPWASPQKTKLIARHLAFLQHRLVSSDVSQSQRS